MTATAPVEVGVDYWEFTCPYDRGWDLLTVLPGGHEVRCNKKGRVIGWRGYTHSAYVAQGQGRVGWSPEDRRMGVHFSLGSEALRILPALDETWLDLPSVMGAVFDELEGRTTRIDICWDDTSGLLDLDVIGQAILARQYVSRWRKTGNSGSQESVNGYGVVDGRTWYMGHGSSDSQLVFYDKRIEQLQKGHDVDVEHWVRAELRLRRERADAMSRLWVQVKDNAQQVMVKVAGILRGMVEFKDANSRDSNKQRQPIAPWWGRFLGYAEKGRLAVVKAEARTIEDVKQWVSLQMGPTLALLEQAMGFDKAWAFLYAEAQDGRARMGPRHRAILAASAATV